MSFRIEKDTIGEIKVESDKYWGAQTERSRNNFKIGSPASMPIEIIHAFAVLKKAAAITNFQLGVLDEKKKDLISKVCDEILDNILRRVVLPAPFFPIIRTRSPCFTSNVMSFSARICFLSSS